MPASSDAASPALARLLEFEARVGKGGKSGAWKSSDVVGRLGALEAAGVSPSGFFARERVEVVFGAASSEACFGVFTEAEAEALEFAAT